LNGFQDEEYIIYLSPNHRSISPCELPDQQGQGSEIEFPSITLPHNDIKAIMFYISIPSTCATN